MMWLTGFMMFLLLSSKDFVFINLFPILDSASMFMSCVTPMAFCIISLFLFNFTGLKERYTYLVMFFLTLSFVTASFVCNSTLHFIIMLELCVYPMSLLILAFSKDSDKYISVIFMFCINIVGSIPFMMFVYNTTSATNSCALLSWGASFNLGLSNFFLFLCFLLVLVSKLPLFFFHFWLTKAHVSASGSCSMILASLMLKLGSFGLYKFFYLFAFCSLMFLDFFMGVSLTGCLFFCVVMIRFFDLKYLIACSSILHMSLILPLVVSGSSVGLVGSLFMMTGHGLVSYYLFFLVTMVYEFSLNRSVDFNKSLESLSKTIMLTLFIFSFMNLGFPPFVNFYSELFFCTFLFNYSLVSIILFCLTMLLSIMFTMYLIGKGSFGKKGLYFYVDKDYMYNSLSLSFVSGVVLLPFML